MRQLHPTSLHLPLADLYDGLEFSVDHGQHLVMGMVASVDGASSVDGVSGQLGGDADGVAFRRLREAVDAILVGAGTVRAEQYRPVTLTGARRDSRVSRGLAPAPQLVIVSRRLALDKDHPVFGDSLFRPLIATCRSAPQARRAVLAKHADVVDVGDDDVDLQRLVEVLGAQGQRRILSEGGPQLNGALLARGLVDEVFLTIAPVIALGPSSRIALCDMSLAPAKLDLLSAYEHEGELLLRYRCRHEQRPS